MEENFFQKNKVYLAEILVLFIVLVAGAYVFIDHRHKQNLKDNIVSEEVLRQVDEGLQANIDLLRLHSETSSNSNISENQLQDLEEQNKLAIKKYEKETLQFNEERLFEFISYENEPSLLDKLIADLVIKNNSTDTPENTCQGKDLLEKEECKRSLFVGCAEALYLKFSIVNECVQFEKVDYVNYLKAKKELIENIQEGIDEIITVETQVGVVSPSPFALGREDLEATIDSSILNNDFSKIDLSAISNESKVISFNQLEDEIKKENLDAAKTENQESKSEQKVLNSLLTSLTGVIVKYSGWVQGWATVFATLNGRPEAGFKMYETTAFGFNPYSSNSCLISLPYKTVDKFFGTNLNYCVRNKLISCIESDKAKVKGKPIEVVMIKNGRTQIFPLGDLGPAEWTGNALDLNGCAAKRLGATGKDQVRFRVAR